MVEIKTVRRHQRNATFLFVMSLPEAENWLSKNPKIPPWSANFCFYCGFSLLNRDALTCAGNTLLAAQTASELAGSFILSARANIQICTQGKLLVLACSLFFLLSNQHIFYISFYVVLLQALVSELKLLHKEQSFSLLDLLLPSVTLYVTAG